METYKDATLTGTTAATDSGDFGPVVLVQGRSFTFVSFGFLVGLGALFSSLHTWLYLGTYQIMPQSSHAYKLALALAFGAPLSAYILTRILDLKTWLSGEKPFFEYIRTVSFGLWGGLVGGLAILIGFAALTQTPLLALLDSFAVGVPLAQVFGRLGCLNYGCCHGKECSSSHPFGIRYFNKQTKVLRYDPELKGKRLHPTQIYAALGNLAIYSIILMIWLRWDTRPEGLLAAVYMSLYGLKRFSVEFIRGEFPRIFFYGLTVWQWFSLSFIVVGLAVMSFALKLSDSAGVANFDAGIQSMQSGFGLLLLVSVILGLAYGTHGRKIGSW
jgi:prolipoprotein diacylglyceryl transferase